MLYPHEVKKQIFQKQDDEGPMAEYDYWHDREIGLGVLVEQLKHSSVTAVLKVLNEAQSPKAVALSDIKGDVLRYYIEARDNDKFLYTVLRYFKVRLVKSNLSTTISEVVRIT